MRAESITQLTSGQLPLRPALLPWIVPSGHANNQLFKSRQCNRPGRLLLGIVSCCLARVVGRRRSLFLMQTTLTRVGDLRHSGWVAGCTAGVGLEYLVDDI